MLHFRMRNILKFTQNSLVVFNSILAYLFTAMLYDDVINVILCLWVNVVWFNSFDRLRGLIWAE